jgi:hypothetical protein
LQTKATLPATTGASFFVCAREIFMTVEAVNGFGVMYPGVLPVQEVSELSLVEETIASEPRVRGATMGDLDALVTIELAAYQGVYGAEPDQAVVDGVRDKYQERIEFLGNYIRVLETPEDGVYGMIVCCPTNLSRDELLTADIDMTDNANIRNAYDADGKSGYVVNLAVHPDKQGIGASALLFADGMAVAMEQGVERTFFESRLPGFQKWLDKRFGAEAASELTEDNLDGLVEEYASATRIVRGQERPVDSLLRIYTDIGAVPLRIVKDAWKPDRPSKSYGMLCELELPKPEAVTVEEAVPTDVLEIVAEPEASMLIEGGAIQESDIAKHGLSAVFDRIKGWRRHKTEILLGSAVAGLGYSALAGDTGKILDAAREELPWVGTAWGGSMAVYAASAAYVLYSAGRSVNVKNIFGNFREEMGHARGKIRSDRLTKTAFWTNAVAGVTAGVVASAGIVETLPPSAWGALAVPFADMYGTVALRKAIYGSAPKESDESAAEGDN